MATYLKIRKSDKAILAQKEMESPDLAYDKPTVWLRLVVGSVPAYDASTQGLTYTVTVPDVFDGSEDVTGEYSVTDLVGVALVGAFFDNRAYGELMDIIVTELDQRPGANATTAFDDLVTDLNAAKS